ncbi:MAG: Hsp20/alpha crystallin family protein [Planctomycetaceae bacterium]
MQPEVKHETATVAKQESETPQGSERTRARKVYIPFVDIVETEQALLLIADVPGVDEQGVDVTIEKNVLTLRGAVAAETPAGHELGYEEYGIGDYERSFTLPNEIDRDGIRAEIKDGVLKLTLPKIKQAVARKVAVTVG